MNPTAKQRLVLEDLRRVSESQATIPFRDFCESKHGQANECTCDKVHFVTIDMPCTDRSLGDCSYLVTIHDMQLNFPPIYQPIPNKNTCHRITEGCKYVHYEIDPRLKLNHNLEASIPPPPIAPLAPPQWLECDVRKMDLKKLGCDYRVIMCDPPWDIHMQLPYGTMTDDEMKQMPIGDLQQGDDGGFLFLWVTGRAMELARLCLHIWGYRRVDEIVWIKTNQLQRIIRTGRTGHWLNHGKEHCIIAVKGNPKNYNIGIDSDVLVAEVRETSRKPDEIYNLIERMCPGGKKLEIFGRKHNTRPGWLTLGNQLGGSFISDPELRERLYGTSGTR
ncbi:hypothetical protein CcCBS67573_g01089 [Chytriomyces confervae]|uniref:mRNA m(6)A methyltransferase n=1 Tax=Chytriomyces confervae TaxID=246404 RepID=A0A507FQB3_9FUNG|nr:N6-adenosine-methyltransferase subunit mettl3 [Chytriomyces hyalinus]TPX77648.1 hypothetical protein CcCBS67573_g01089 [Chytriomyces confervae]